MASINSFLKTFDFFREINFYILSNSIKIKKNFFDKYKSNNNKNRTSFDETNGVDSSYQLQNYTLLC